MGWRLAILVVTLLAGTSSAALRSLEGQQIRQLPPLGQRRPDSVLMGRVDGANPDKPDAVVEQVAIKKDVRTILTRAVHPGEEVLLSCQFYDQGLAGPEVWWSVGHYIDGVRVQSQQMRGLSATTHTGTAAKYVVPAAEGIHYYECRLDEDNVLTEMDKRNNRQEIAFRVESATGASGAAFTQSPAASANAAGPAVPGARRPPVGPATPLPDLVVKDIVLDGIRAVVRVQNAGAAPVGNMPVDVQLYWDDNPWWEPVWRGGGSPFEFGPGEYRTYTNYYWDLHPRGTYRLRAVVDSQKKIRESNEMNNELTVTFIRR